MNEFSNGMSLLAFAADKAVETISDEPVVNYGTRLGYIFLLFVLPYVVGSVLSRVLRLKDFSNRIGTVLLAFTLGLSPFVYQIITTGELSSWQNAIRLGIDLNGGTNLTYQVDTKQAEADGKDVSSAMDKIVGVIQGRINPSGTEEVVVRRVGQDRIEIIIPGVDQGVVAQKKADMVRLGSLEFGIVANMRDHRNLIQKALLKPENRDVVEEGSRVAAVWRDISPDADSMQEDGGIGVRVLKTRKHAGKDKVEKPVEQILIIKEQDENLVTGKYLTRASVGMSENATPAVNFNFNNEGGQRFFRLTNKYRPTQDGQHKRRLAILLDNRVHSAPNINSTIRDSGQITGNFTGPELESLVNVLNAGALELPINPTPIGEFSISSLLGASVKRKGMFALAISMVAVFVFMLWYYRFSGLVANVSLILNMILIVGSMAICNATFTLPGLAGMVLTIGMAVDTNVLIYERMREEMTRGSSLRMVIHNGFDKALSAIVDSNITTLIAAVVLFMIGSDQLKGFAVSLFIGITMSMFSALYFGHLMFDIAERKRLIRDRLSMAKLIGIPNIDFIGKMKTALTFSISFITLGVVLVIARGEESLDIDFRGGSMVTFKFEKPQEIDDVRGKLIETFGPSISLERLALSDEQASDDSGKQFRLRTTEQDVNAIRKNISKTFPFSDANYELHRVTVQYTPVVASSAVPPTSTQPDVKSEKTEAVKPEGASTPEDTSTKCGEDERPVESQDKAKTKSTESKDDPAVKADPVKTDEPVKKDEPKAVAKPAGENGTGASEEPKKAEAVKSESKPAAQATGAADVVSEDIDPFVGGLTTELTFTDTLTTTTAVDYLMKALADVKPTYKDAAALLRVTGTAGPGMDAKEGEVKLFNKMTIEANKVIPSDDLAKALASMQETLATTPIFEEVNNFASSVADDMRYLAIIALLASGVATVIYLWFRFTKADFGIAAVIAVFHDVLFVLACLPFAFYLSKTPLGPLLGLEDFKLNLSIVAAFLTIIGYSLNDTIVIFDRVREIRGRNPALTAQMVNDSVNQTMSRTILTALTVFITVAILYFFGGEGIHGFAFCMLVGTMVGTYSTVFIASPFLLWMWNREQKQKQSLLPQVKKTN